MFRSYNAITFPFWGMLLLVSVRAWLRSVQGGRPKPLWPLTAAFVALLGVANVAVALRLVYVSPLAVTQDIVSARQVLKGEPLPTTGIKPLVKQVLAEERRPAPLGSLWPWLSKAVPGLAGQEQRAFDGIADVISVQAHPPFATVFLVPFVWSFGVYGSALAFSLLSLACFGVTLPLLYRGLDLDLSASQKVLIGSALLGWYPMFYMLRSGQWGAILGLLVVAGWFGVRRDRPAMGGAAVGLAAALKVFPALLLVYLFFRHRRAFWAGVASVTAVTAVTAAVFGVQSYVDYMRTARTVAGWWGQAPENWSLSGTLHRLGVILSVPELSSRTAYLAAVLLLVAAISALPLLSSARPPGSRTDLEYSLFVVASTWLSPICWSHYFVVLLLPLAVLANRALRERASSSLMFFGLFLTVALPDGLTKDVLFPAVERHLGPQAGLALLLLPPLALLGMMIWLAALDRTPSGFGGEPEPIPQPG